MRSDYLNANSGAFLEGVAVKGDHTEQHAADVTLNAVQDVGGVHIVTAADKTVTLPAVGTGQKYTVVLGVDLGASEYMRVDTNASDKWLGGCGLAASTDGKYIGVTGAKAGAVITCEYGTADGWFITRMDDASAWTYES